MKAIVASRIKDLRIKSGLSQVELARLRNVSQATVAKQELGERTPGEEGIVWYANYFNVSTDYLLGRTDIPNFYAHDVLLEDGRAAVYWTSEKDLTKQQLDQVVETAREAASGESGVPVLSVDSTTDMESLSALVRRIVDQALEERESGAGQAGQ